MTGTIQKALYVYYPITLQTAELMRGYILNENDNDVTVNFYIGGNAITPGIMRGINNRSVYNLRVLSETASILVFNNVKMTELEVRRPESTRQWRTERLW